MRVFSNPVGSGTLWFDNLITAEGTPVGYDPQARSFVASPPYCANREIIGCNWIAPEPGAFCRSWAMTALAPDRSVPNVIPNWRDHNLTSYASCHPHEDWAETAANLLHLTDIADSFIASGLHSSVVPDSG